MSGPLKPPRALGRARRGHGLVAAIRDHSPYLTSLIEEDPERAQRLFDAEPQAALAAVVAALDSARFADETQAMRALRRAKRETHLAVALAGARGSSRRSAITHLI